MDPSTLPYGAYRPHPWIPDDDDRGRPRRTADGGRSSSVDGPDDTAAAAMSDLGERPARAGALTEAAQAFSHAAALSADPDARARLLTIAADVRFDNGDLDGAFEAVESAIRDGRCRRAGPALPHVGLVEVAACCVAELALVGETMRSIDPSGAAAALGRSSSSGYLDGDLAMAIRRARDGDQLASQQGDFVTAAACAGALAWNALLVGDWSGAAVVGDDQPVALERSEDDACVIAKHT